MEPICSGVFSVPVQEIGVLKKLKTVSRELRTENDSEIN